MDRDEFKASVAECAALLKAVQKMVPKRVDAELLNYLDRLKDDPAGLDMLQAAIAPRS
jgi:hypothetical protein